MLSRQAILMQIPVHILKLLLHKLKFGVYHVPISTASRNMISSHSWKVDLSSTDGYAEIDPRMKSFHADPFSLEDPDMAEHQDFLNYWEHDY